MLLCCAVLMYTKLEQYALTCDKMLGIYESDMNDCIYCVIDELMVGLI